MSCKAAGCSGYLILLAAVSLSNVLHCSWLQHSGTQPWNVIVVAPTDMDQVTCPHCLFIHRFDPEMHQGRYGLLYELMQTEQWAQLVADRHQYLYFPEEGVVQDVSTINT